MFTGSMKYDVVDWLQISMMFTTFFSILAQVKFIRGFIAPGLYSGLNPTREDKNPIFDSPLLSLEKAYSV